MNYIIWFLFSLLAGLYIAGPISDPDLWWHIVVGRWIIANGTVPHVDYWNMFGVSLPWRAYSWSNEILFAWVDKTWGIWGLVTLQALLAVGIAFVFSLVFGKIAQDHFVGSLLGFYATVATFNHFTLRPQSFTWIFFALLIYSAEQISRSGVNRRNLTLVFLWLLLWANSHLTAFLGLLTVLAWAYVPSNSKSTRNSLVIIGVGLVALIATPNFGGEIFTLFSKASHPFQYSSIAEFQPAQINQYSTAFLVIIFAIFLTFLFQQSKAVNVVRIALAFSFVIAGFAVVKFIPQAVIVLAALIATIWARYKEKSEKLGNLGVALSKMKRGYYSVGAGQGLAIFLVAGIALQIVRINSYPLSLEQTPKEAVDFIIDKNLPGPILNIFGDGGYLMYRFSDDNGTPKMLVPIDGRTNVNSPDIMRLHGIALRGQLGWKDYINAVKPEVILWRTEGPLTSLLLENSEWCLVHRDGTDEKGHVVFVKRESQSNLPCS